jgi:hypothetical protein
MPQRILDFLPRDTDNSPVLSVSVKVVPEADAWGLYVSVMSMPDCENYVVSHRVGAFAARNRATLAGMWMLRAAERHMRVQRRAD